MDKIEALNIVKSIYTEADQIGNMRPIFNNLAEDVIFHSTIPAGTPISGTFKGKQNVIDFYTNLLPSVAIFQRLTPSAFVMRDDRVIIVGENIFTLVSTGQTYYRPYVYIISMVDRLIAAITLIQDFSGISAIYRKTKKHC
ncbi:hypothetical protein RYH73_24060 [Olivibacter sp. CPCC 100613]|uniref:nuclear transport factor 2 family protein n=1 Tax=Olivibacter sp. CPCC 100613 TaxID=3079931 RepID=UPI002FFB3357